MPYKTDEEDYSAGVASLGTSGKTCFIQGGAGGLGSIAIQYAKWVLQMHVIVSCSKRNSSFCKKLGADVCIDYHETNFLETSRFLKNQVDVVFDPYSWLYREKTLNSSLPVLRPGGWYLDIASSPHSRAEAMRRNLCDSLELAVPEASLPYLVARGVNMATVGAKSLFSTMSFNLLKACSTHEEEEEEGEEEADRDGSASNGASTGAGVGVGASASGAANTSPAAHTRTQTPQGFHYSLTYVKSSARDLRTISRYCRAGFILPVVGKRKL
jgi:threonine dehydrogenase-like Zn-dependent dehydrogenase